MKKVYCLLLFALVIGLHASAQEKRPVIQSNTKDIIFKHDGAVVNWYMEEGKNPDIYSIGNNLNAHTVKVITDIDSARFVLAPGEKYDFDILFKKTTTFPTQINVLRNPFFFNPPVYISLGIILLGLFIILILARKSISTITLLRLGLISGLLFWLMIIIGGLLQRHYSHTKMGVSQLGTIGTESEVFMAIASMLLALLTLLFNIGFIKAARTLKVSIIPAVLSISMSVSMAWGATFPSGNTYHGLLGPLPLGIMTGALLVFLLWRRNGHFSAIRKLSLISFGIMLLFILRFVPNLQQQFEGLIQRTLWLGWSVWYISLSIWLPRLIRDSKTSISATGFQGT